MALHVNTAQTIFGFFSTLFRQIGPLNLSGGDLVDIFNYIPLDERIHTSGQPSSGQFSAIKAAGFTHVINLAPHDAENAIADEAGRLKALDIRYNAHPGRFQRTARRGFRGLCRCAGRGFSGTDLGPLCGQYACVGFHVPLSP